MAGPCFFRFVFSPNQAFLQARIDRGGVVATYVGLPLFLGVWAAYRLVRGGGIVRYADMQFPAPKF